jgi:hypothetical protein
MAGEMVSVSSRTGNRRCFLVDTVRIRRKNSKFVNLVGVTEKWDKCAGKMKTLTVRLAFSLTR